MIGSSISVQGDIKGEEDLTILGRVQGTVDVKNNSVTVGQSGHVKADLHADLIVVEGRVEGNLFGTDQIILRATANVQGNLTAPRVALEDGAQFKGAIDMEPVRKGPASSGAAGGSERFERSKRFGRLRRRQGIGRRQGERQQRFRRLRQGHRPRRRLGRIDQLERGRRQVRERTLSRGVSLFRRFLGPQGKQARQGQRGGTEEPEGAGGERQAVRLRSLALGTLFSHLVPGGAYEFLDLGPAIGPNVEFLSRYVRSVRVGDLWATLRATAPTSGPERIERALEPLIDPGAPRSATTAS